MNNIGGKSFTMIGENGLKCALKRVNALFFVRKKNHIVNFVISTLHQIIEIRKYDRNVESIVVFFNLGAVAETGLEFLSGGVMSIASLVAESRDYFHESGTEVICCTYYGVIPIYRYRRFESTVRLFQFWLIKMYFRCVKQLTLHIPEILVRDFVENHIDDSWLHVINFVNINIMNQNVQLMPENAFIQRLQEAFDTVTITSAHKRYCNRAMREFYGVPLHLFSTFVSKEQYETTFFDEKEDLILISNDNPDLARIVKSKLNERLPNFQVEVIRDLTHAEYKKKVLRSKFTFTLGEGLDFYFIETYFSGGIAFAIRNQDFFDDEYLSLSALFLDECHLVERCADKIEETNNKYDYTCLNANVCSILDATYSSQNYKRNIASYYEQRYTLP